MEGFNAPAYDIRNEHVSESQRLAASLIKRVENEDPRTVLLAFAQCFVSLCQVNKIRRPHIFELVKTLYYALNNPTVNDAQEAASRLFLPGNY